MFEFLVVGFVKRAFGLDKTFAAFAPASTWGV
jgi:hypothetical protein